MIIHKKCTKCKVNKPTFSFSKQKGTKSGLRSQCKKCVSKWQKKYTQTERGKEVGRKGDRKYKANHKDVMRERSWNSRGIKITYNDFNKKFVLQKGCCAICGQHQSNFKNSLSVDHDHKTGKVRDLVCVTCNHLIGYVETRKETLKKVELYLKKWNK